MNVITAKSAGFCFGVKRAIDLVLKEIEENNGNTPIYTYGPIIHNENVVNDLKEKGVSVIEEGDDLSSYSPGTVIIRSHGVSKQVYESIDAAGHKIVDATCPFVKKIHNLVSEHSKNNEEIIVIGDPEHPEVKGIIGYIENNGFSVINSKEEAEEYTNISGKKTVIVSQTTYNLNKFQELVEIISEKGYDIEAVGTICNATEERQTEAAQIASQADVMLVIGSKSSSNSRKLEQICREKCNQTFFIQTAKDLNLVFDSLLSSIKTIGITAGASTPNNIIKEVQNNVSRKF